ncbi:WxL domain-containing protein [Tetragenococcus osmophilus]|uniref:Cell surface protein n=1 Tax=Tetragenococcus osmophilus TaxID=526944 RepID=A0AA38CXY0_9ENTE|nr:WxL domain-containing protein [Tetragenococcus osmophilus]AYW48286.1 WxL domain-containing protein [Tetragenococcus osmophilus]GMA54089.1 cell surface protein [Alicyclobacillus contaminans]GMA72024.1 cell surface protein [Tetragenococcus osmophilus]
MKKLSALGVVLIGLGILTGINGTIVDADSSATTSANATVEKPDPNDPEDTGETGDGETGDPTDPDGDDEYTPDESNPGTPGLLRIDHAPSSFDFGTIKVGRKQTKYAGLESGSATDGAEKSVPNYVKVTDNTGNFAGWELSVSRTEFTNQEDDTQTLDGTELSFNNAYANAGSKGAGMPTTVASDVNIPVNSKTVLVQAHENEGMGEWFYVLGENNEEAEKSVALDVPVKQYAPGNYSSTLDWNLTDAPSDSSNME